MAGPDDQRVFYNFYQKPMKSRLLILKTSAMSKSQRMNILTQKVFRRLHNAILEVDDEVKTGIMNNFMVDMKESGYNERERLSVLKSGLKTYENIEDKVKKGDRPFYRPAGFNKDARRKEKVSTWPRDSTYLIISLIIRIFNDIS